MRILIDGRFIGVGESISRYTLEIVKGILDLDKKNDYTLLIRSQGEKIAKQFLQTTNNKSQKPNKQQITNPKNRPMPSALRPANLKLKVLNVSHYSLAEQTKLLKYLNKEKFDLVHFTQFNHPVRYRGKFVVTIHDLTLLGHLYRMNPIKRWGFRAVMKSAVKNSKKIITISEYSKQDIIKTYGADPGKIEVTYLGIDNKFKPLDKSTDNRRLTIFRQKYGISDNYILYTGMWKRHKNLVRMLKAFEKVISKHQITNEHQNDKFQKLNSKNLPSAGYHPQTNLQLVFVGKIDNDEKEVISEINRINKSAKSLNSKHLSTFHSIVTTGYVDENELPTVYAGALFYCIPSLSEGFGLPPLEAMACGTPVISSKTSAMPEILGDAAEYFDPYDVEDIEKTMIKLASNKKLRDELSKKGLERTKKYSWSNTAKETLEVYKSI